MRNSVHEKVWIGVALTAMSFGLVSCGEEKSQVEGSLSQLQKEKLVGTLDSAGRAQVAMKAVGQRSDFRTYMQAPDLGEISDMRRRLSESLQRGGDCRYSISPGGFEIPSPTRGAPSRFHILMKMEGADCPAIMHFEVKGEFPSAIYPENVQQVRFDLNIAYQVQDPEFEKLNDVKAFQFKGGLGASGNANGGQAEFTLNGFIESRSNGNVTLNWKGDLVGTSSEYRGQFLSAFGFPDFTANLLLTFRGTDPNQEPQVGYFLNGRSIDADDYFSYFKRLFPVLDGSAVIAAQRMQ